jgi:hypothetical protein
MAESVDLGILGLTVPSGTHLCVFFRGQSGRDDIVIPFLVEGIRAKDRCICVLDSPAPSDYLSLLGRQINVGPPVASGQLQIATPAEAYLRSGQFSTQDMLDYWGEAAEASQGESGFRLTRGTGEMPSVLDHPDGRAEFFRYEARLNEVLPTYPQVILCLYDLERWGASVLMDALRTHPVVVVDGMAHENPYYIEPGKFLVGRD